MCNENTEGSINHRHQMTLMMVLTATSYKMAIAGKLPPVSYLTWLDKYTLSNYLLIIAVAVQSRAGAHRHAARRRRAADRNV